MRQEIFSGGIMARRTTGEAKIWLALGLFVTGLATAAPSAAAVDKTLATQVAQPISNDEVKTAAEVGAQSVDVVPVAQRISPIGKTLANLRGYMPDYLGSNANGEMFWYNVDNVLKSTATGPISIANFDQEKLAQINLQEGFVDQSGNLFYSESNSCFVLKKLSLGAPAPVNLSAPHQDEEECASTSPTNGLVSGKELLQTANLAFDASGNIYLTEKTIMALSTKIRKITTSGVLSTIAGTGILGSTGADGSAATAANITLVGDIDVDGSGNVYFIDGSVEEQKNARIRRIKPDGTIETFRTAGADREFRQVLAGPDGAVYFTERVIENDSYDPLYRITKVNPNGSVVYIGDGTEGSSGDGASAALAKIGSPFLVDVLSDNSLIFSYYNGTSDLATDPFENQWTIHRRVTSDGMISTLSGLGDVVLNYGYYNIGFGIAGEDSLVTDSSVELVPGATETLWNDGWEDTVITRSASGDGVEMYGNYGTGVDYVHARRTVSSTGTITDELNSQVPFDPDSVGYDASGNAYYIPQGECRVMKRTPAGTTTTYSGTADCSDDGHISDGGSLAVSHDGTVYWAPSGYACEGYNSCKIVKISGPSGNQEIIAETAAGCSEYPDNPPTNSGGAKSICFSVNGMTVDRGGNLYISDYYAGNILKLSFDGQFSPLTVDGDYYTVSHLAFSVDGSLYFSDSDSIQKIVGVAATDPEDFAPPSAAVLDALPTTLAVPNATIQIGRPFVLTELGFDPFEWVVISLQSTPQVLDTVQADASGVISVTVTIPDGVSFGVHTLSALGTTSGVGSRTAITISAGFNLVALDSPKRLVDTRAVGGRFGSSSASGVSVLRLKVAGALTVKGAASGLPSSGVGAVAMNVTVVEGKDKDGYGFVTVYPCASDSTPVPDASNLNFAGGQTVPNSVLAPVSADGHVCFSVYGDTHLLVDVAGYVPAGSGLTALDSPKRLVDTRAVGGRFGSSSASGVSVLRLKVAGALTVKGAASGLPVSGVGAVAMNVTVVDGKDKDGYGFVTVYPCASDSTSVPDASNLNFAGGQTVPNSVLAPVSADGHVCFSVYGDTHLLVDVSAYA
jgi:hypothetical protein